MNKPSENKPGEYSFALTPRKPGPYRIFADIVPALSNVQEYASCELPGTGGGEKISPAQSTTTAEVDGLRYDLQWELNGGELRAQQAAPATMQIAEVKSGQPFAKLEPIMGTFAHIVAFRIIPDHHAYFAT